MTVNTRDWTPEDDDLDGVLFRFWIRAASYPGGWPTRLMEVMNEEIKAEGHASPAAYRRGLVRLAIEKGVNLPATPSQTDLIDRLDAQKAHDERGARE